MTRSATRRTLITKSDISGFVMFTEGKGSPSFSSLYQLDGNSGEETQGHRHNEKQVHSDVVNAVPVSERGELSS